MDALKFTESLKFFSLNLYNRQVQLIFNNLLSPKINKLMDK